MTPRRRRGGGEPAKARGSLGVAQPRAREISMDIIRIRLSRLAVPGAFSGWVAFRNTVDTLAKQQAAVSDYDVNGDVARRGHGRSCRPRATRRRRSRTMHWADRAGMPASTCSWTPASTTSKPERPPTHARNRTPAWSSGLLRAVRDPHLRVDHVVFPGRCHRATSPPTRGSNSAGLEPPMVTRTTTGLWLPRADRNIAAAEGSDQSARGVFPD